ncbi:hypothetical protein GCM10010387_67450 [Streptomyces inusitatus]|uniref:Uncharacterized protein n=1 Tax=Streptomyces inusitatus TaxID=68221 RepID=A0A918QSW7_9ACTN|nr:hypothetical protein [Streptomyces inusitatus]GGZ64880.1 hypothetical protein GCM10010387_67450 [Streptomyces inusitatus]
MPPVDLTPQVDWEEFLRRFRWAQGEHISFIGPTGSGKTTLARQLLHRRAYVAALATKPRDKTMDGLIRNERFKRIRSWEERPPIIGRNGQRVVLWPEFRRPEDQLNQQYQLSIALREMFVAGGWCVFADELFYLCHTLKLTKLLETYWTQGRSLGLSLVGGTQRPAHVPLFAYDQATHLFFWRDNDETNLRRVSGLGGMSAKEIRAAVTRLPEHHALYVNTRDGEMMITRAPRG